MDLIYHFPWVFYLLIVAVLLVEGEGLLVVGLHVEHHLRNAAVHHAVLNGLLEQQFGGYLLILNFAIAHHDRHLIGLPRKTRLVAAAQVVGHL